LGIVHHHHDVVRVARQELPPVQLLPASRLRVRGQDAGVGAAQPKPRERRADQDEEDHHRDEHAPGMRHHEGGEAVPHALAADGLVGVEIGQAERIDTAAENGEQRGEKGQREPHRD
jgi:hypothetical protein